VFLALFSALSAAIGEQQNARLGFATDCFCYSAIAFFYFAGLLRLRNLASTVEEFT